jgi:hypothetical protein
VRQNVSLATEASLSAAGDAFYLMAFKAYGGMVPGGAYNVWCDDMRCFQHRRTTFSIGAYFNASAVKDSLNMPRNLTYRASYFNTPLSTNADRATSSLPNLERLLDAGVRVLVYNGVGDAFLGVQGSRQALRALNYSRSAAFRGAELRTFGWISPDYRDLLLRGNFLSDAAAGQPGTALLTHASVFGAGHFANAEKLDYTRLLVLQWVADNTIQTPNTTTTAHTRGWRP